MNFSEEWKSLFPVGSVFQAPLLLSNADTKSSLGPLCFNPNPDSLSTLFHSPSALSPPFLDPPSRLSLSRFLVTSTSGDSFIPPSTASRISSSFRPHVSGDGDYASSFSSRNRIQLLYSPDGNSVFVFFPTGSNFDEIGFLLLESKDGGGGLGAAARVRTGDKRLKQRVIGILVNPIEDPSWVDGGGGGGESSASCSGEIGYVLAYCMNSVHWFRVSVGPNGEKPGLSYVGGKENFRSSAVVSACWSPHLLQQSVVLLDDGSLFLFDLESWEPNGSNSCFRGTRLKVAWDDHPPNSEKCKWLGCEFSWHPKVLIVVRSDAAFLVDWTGNRVKVTCLAKVDMFGLYASAVTTRFLAFSKAVSSHFHFILVSGSLLVLCDVLKPLLPVLQWAHGLDKPCYVDTFTLSNLRSNCRDNTHDWATKSGFGIVLGSFLNSEFSLFCYGPPLPARDKSVSANIYQVSKPLYAWELPSFLNLQNADCVCGSCLVKEEFYKGELPEWVDRNQKRDVVLGFSIVRADLCSSKSEPDEFGGFTLIRLMSSGKLELQQYSASWDLVRTLKDHSDDLVSSHDGNYLYSSLEDEKYKFPKKFTYLELDYVSAYLNGDLSRILDLKLRNSCKDPKEKRCFDPDCHEALSEKLKNIGLDRFRASPIANLVLTDVNMPASIHDVASRKIWAGLPMELLQHAFSNYSELRNVLLFDKKVSLEFLAVPDLPQLPPFPLRQPSHRSSKWSNSVPRDEDALVGPVLPLPFLITLHELRNGSQNSEEEAGDFSPEVELNAQCNEVMEMAKEVAVVADSMAKHGDGGAVSLASQNDDIWVNDSQQLKSFMMYRPVAAVKGGSSGESSFLRDQSFSTLITKLNTKEDQMDDDRQIFEDVCPINLKFDTDLDIANLGTEEKRAYKVLRLKLVQWQEQFKPYKDFCSRH